MAEKIHEAFSLAGLVKFIRLLQSRIIMDQHLSIAMAPEDSPNFPLAGLAKLAHASAKQDCHRSTSALLELMW